MAIRNDPLTKIAELPLPAFELPNWLIEPAVRSCRLFNTALDFIFYDVPTLRAALAKKDAPMQAQGEKPPSRIIDFDALSDPEGSLLLFDATTAPYVHKYESVKKFLESPYQETRDGPAQAAFAFAHTTHSQAPPDKRTSIGPAIFSLQTRNLRITEVSGTGAPVFLRYPLATSLNRRKFSMCRSKFEMR